jgi:hypothetical protein
VETSRKESFAKFSQDTDGRMDLGDFASLLKVVSPSMEEYDVAHLYMELVDSRGNVDPDEWLLVLSLYEAVRHEYCSLESPPRGEGRHYFLLCIAMLCDRVRY